MGQQGSRALLALGREGVGLRGVNATAVYAETATESTRGATPYALPNGSDRRRSVMDKTGRPWARPVGSPGDSEDKGSLATGTTIFRETCS